MPVPKKKVSRSRRGKRRSHHGISLPILSTCPQCHEVKPPHQVCPNCGYYKGNEIVKVEEME
ncbi:MAG TPA: 50S ribosomal protein L32 [Nitrospinae bacterium]|nr:50S ribosomal protein L32 [Nitrospinota bacterium]HBA27212.1 50S ribosomal protein L32 [Nitrospinota bacterium]